MKEPSYDDEFSKTGPIIFEIYSFGLVQYPAENCTVLGMILVLKQKSSSQPISHVSWIYIILRDPNLYPTKGCQLESIFQK